MYVCVYMPVHVSDRQTDNLCVHLSVHADGLFSSRSSAVHAPSVRLFGFFLFCECSHELPQIQSFLNHILTGPRPAQRARPRRKTRREERSRQKCLPPQRSLSSSRVKHSMTSRRGKKMNKSLFLLLSVSIYRLPPSVYLSVPLSLLLYRPPALLLS